MKLRLIEAVCPHCHNTFQIKRDTYLIEGLDKKAEKSMDEETWFFHQCSQCRKLFEIQQPLMYKMPEKNTLIVLSGQKDLSFLKGEGKIIQTLSPFQFYTARFAVKHSLDLKKLILVLKTLQNKYHCYIRLIDYDENSEILYFQHELQLAGVCLKDFA